MMDLPLAGTTKPKPRAPKGIILDPKDLVGGRYGTDDMVKILGWEKTVEKQLYVQGTQAQTYSDLHPDIILPEHAAEIVRKATTQHVSPARVSQLEALLRHDVHGLLNALGEKLDDDVASSLGRDITSSDLTQPARALQIKEALEVFINDVEILRDITIERTAAWIDIPHMDTSHWYDALPTVAGRPFAFYAELLHSDLMWLKHIHDNSIMGKLADATGNHHQATASGIDGLALQEEFCQRLGVGHMIAPSQLPGLEFEMDVFYGLSRTFETIGNLARYVRWGRSSDVALFSLPRKGKGSVSMPHKDLFGGNPIAEEQDGSVRNSAAGLLVTALLNCQMEYSRDLTASANARINLDYGFKFADHGIRRLQKVIFDLQIDEDRAQERIDRTYGITTSSRVVAYLTDHRRCDNPLTREAAHDLMGELATQAFTSKTQFTDVLLRNPQVTSRLDEPTIRELSNPYTYIGESKEIIQMVVDECYQKKTLEAA